MDLKINTLFLFITLNYFFTLRHTIKLFYQIYLIHLII